MSDSISKHQVKFPLSNIFEFLILKKSIFFFIAIFHFKIIFILNDMENNNDVVCLVLTGERSVDETITSEEEFNMDGENPRKCDAIETRTNPNLTTKSGHTQA